jgi:pilus assembly protein CpaF
MASWSDLRKNGRLAPERKKQLVDQVVRTIQADDYPLLKLRDRRWLREKALEITRNVSAKSSAAVSPASLAAVSEAAVARVGGLGFLHKLLPPVRDDLSEISLDGEGRLWLMPRADVSFHPHPYQPTREEAWRSVDALLAHSGQSVSRATPSVDARLPRSAGMGGARVKVIHPSVAPGVGYPLFNIRLFEPKPVRVEQLLDWEAAPEMIFSFLEKAVKRGKRILITGGTYTGKTTVLSALANFIPKKARILKIEDPEEIWIDHPHVVTLEARPAPPGSDVPGYSITDGVNDGMRLSPRWLIVGEVRRGEVALDLFSAQMSDHPGMSTFHAESPQEAVHRMAVMMFNARGVRFRGAKEFFAAAVDLVVQLGWVKGERKLLGIWGVGKKLTGGDVDFHPLWLSPDYEQRVKTNNVEELQGMMKEIEHEQGSKR